MQSSLLPRNTYTSARNFQFCTAQPGQVQRMLGRNGKLHRPECHFAIFPCDLHLALIQRELSTTRQESRYKWVILATMYNQ